jgi:hypothetical protein
MRNTTSFANPPPAATMRLSSPAASFFAEIGVARVRLYGCPETVLSDVKRLFSKGASDGRL